MQLQCTPEKLLIEYVVGARYSDHFFWWFQNKNQNHKILFLKRMLQRLFVLPCI